MDELADLVNRCLLFRVIPMPDFDHKAEYRQTPWKKSTVSLKKVFLDSDVLLDATLKRPAIYCAGT
jgi:hypothetical protein